MNQICMQFHSVLFCIAISSVLMKIQLPILYMIIHAEISIHSKLLHLYWGIQMVTTVPGNRSSRTWVNSSPLDKMSAIRSRHFQIHFLEWKGLYFDSNFTEGCYYVSNWQEVCIGSGNYLAPNRRQAITLTNVDPVYWRIYAALGEMS